MHATPTLYVRDPYRVIDDRVAPPHLRFVVVDGSGARFRAEACFDTAREWVDRRVVETGPSRHPRARGR